MRTRIPSIINPKSTCPVWSETRFHPRSDSCWCLCTSVTLWINWTRAIRRFLLYPLSSPDTTQIAPSKQFNNSVAIYNSSYLCSLLGVKIKYFGRSHLTNFIYSQHTLETLYESLKSVSIIDGTGLLFWGPVPVSVWISQTGPDRPVYRSDRSNGKSPVER